MKLVKIGGRLVLLAVATLSVGLVVVAVWLSEWLGLSACPLCIFQRVEYLAVAALALLAVLLRSVAAIRAVAALACVVALAGVATAVWQTRLQLFPDPSLECSYTDPNLIEQAVDWLGMQWPELFLATGLCSSKEWELLGLSMANWSALMFLLLATMLAWTVRRPSQAGSAD